MRAILCLKGDKKVLLPGVTSFGLFRDKDWCLGVGDGSKVIEELEEMFESVKTIDGPGYQIEGGKKKIEAEDRDLIKRGTLWINFDQDSKVKVTLLND